MLDFLLPNYQDVPCWIVVLEAIAFFTGIASVWLAKKEHIGVYPIGLIGTAITVFLLYRAEYYGDMAINFYFSMMSIYGWLMWSKNLPHSQFITVSRTNKKEKMLAFALFLLTIAVILEVYRLFHYQMKWENYLDMLTAGIFFSAMWLMAKKKIENWLLWIIGNCIAIPLFLYRGLGMLALQYIIFTILAVKAHLAWKKTLNSLS